MDHSMPGMPIPPLKRTGTHPERWNSRQHLAHWLSAFRTYFPRKAFIAERVAARLAGCDSHKQLKELLPANPVHDECMERTDMHYAKRRMVQFKEDRLILVLEFGILPDAANQFLTSCPVGCGQFVVDEKKLYYYDDRLSYYPDDQTPSPHVGGVIDQQYQEALNQLVSNVDTSNRLGMYLHPSMLVHLFHFLKWEVTFDTDGRDSLGPSVPATRVGWVVDSELGKIEVFTQRFTAPPNWARDEVFWQVLRAIKSTRDLASKPVVILNNQPMQLFRGGHTFTSVGWLVIESKVMPMLVNHQGHPLSSLLVELVTFDPTTTAMLADEGNVALSVFWSLLRASDKSIPQAPTFHVLPDGWMIPATQ